MRMRMAIAALAALAFAPLQAGDKQHIYLDRINGTVERYLPPGGGQRYWKGSVRLCFATLDKGPGIDFGRGAVTEGAVSVTPEVAELKVAAAGDELHVTGRFEPDVQYRFEVKAGFSDLSGRTLERAGVLTHKMRPYHYPYVKVVMAGYALYMPAKSEEMKIPCYVNGEAKYEILLSKALEHNYGLGYMEWDVSIERGEPLGKFSRTLKSADKYDSEPFFLDLREFSGFDGSPGLYFLTIVRKECGDFDWNDHETVPVFITDLAAQFVTCPNDMSVAVGVTRISDGTPVEGAEVSLVTRKNRYIPLGKTGKDGTLAARAKPGDCNKWSDCRGVVARTADDIVYIDDESLHTRGWHEVGELSRPRAFVYFDRGICRPGDTFTANVHLRDSEGRALGGMPLELALQLYGKDVIVHNVQSDGFGFATCEFALPADAESTLYCVECRPRGGDGACWGSEDIRAACYTADRIKASVAVPEGPVDADSPLSCTVSAEYYFGAKIPSAGLKVRATAAETPAVDFPDAWGLNAADGQWRVGDTKSFSPGAEWRSSCEGSVLPASGEARISIPSFAELGGKAYSPFRRFVSAEVSESGGSTVYAEKGVAGYPTDWFIAARESAGALELRAVAAPGREAKAAAALSAPDARQIVVKVSKVEWHPHMRGTGDNWTRSWERETVELPEFSFATPASAIAEGRTVSHAISGLPGGCYEVLATCGDAIRTRFEFWHDSGEPAALSSNPSVLRLVSDKPSYKPGSTAKLSFKSSGAGTAFVACGERGVEKYSTVEIVPGNNEIEIAVPAGVCGGAYYAAVTVVARGSARGLPRRFALAKLKVDQSAHRLSVKVEAPALVRPEDWVTAKVRVTDAAGAPVPGAQVRLIASDSGVLALTRFATPDPYAFFWGGNRDGIFNCADVFGRIFPDLRILPDGRFGGGDGAVFNPSPIAEKPAVRVVASPVVTGPDGTAEIEFRAPELLGEMRAMAIAATETAAGGGDARFAVAREYAVSISAPRFAFAGDRFTVTATVFNNTKEPADYLFVLDGFGGVQVDMGVPRSGSLAPGASALISYTARAIETSDAAKSGVAAMLGVQSAGYDFSTGADILVRPPRPPSSMTFYRRVKPGEALPFQEIAQQFSGSFTGICKVAASPAVVLAGPFEWLRDYPYGCLEQTASTALPLLAAKELAALGVVPDEAEAETLAAKVDLAVSRVESCIDGKYGFRMWPERGCDWKWTDAGLQAAAFLAEASRRPGARPVPAATVKWLENIANGQLRWGGKEEIKAERERCAFAAWILARIGNDSGLNAARRIVARCKGSFAAFLSAAALVEGGCASEGIGEIRSYIESERYGEGASSDLFGASLAPVVGFAMSVLSELPEEVCAGHEAQLVSCLLINGCAGCDLDIWGGTFNNAWAVYGLARFAARGAAQASSFEGRTIGYSLASPLALTNGTPADMWVTARTWGVPKYPGTDSNGLRLERSYRNLTDRPGGRIMHGDLVEVTLTASGKALWGKDNLVLTDLVPAGFEIEDPNLATRSGSGAFPSEKSPEHCRNLRVERRDDRCLFFFGTNAIRADDRASAKIELRYRLRAVSRGMYQTGEARMEAMYDPTLHASTHGDGALVVE